MKGYLRALPTLGFVPTENRYVAEVRTRFEWVPDLQDATRFDLGDGSETQRKLKEQHHLETELVEISDANLTEQQYVLCREEGAVEGKGSEER